MRIIGGKHRSRQLELVGKASTRETADLVKGAVFNMLGSTLSGTVLDLFAGSGAYGLEAISRGASFAYLVDIDQDAVKTIHKNSASLGESAHVSIHQKDYQQFIRQLEKKETFDYVFLDPPYALNMYQDIISTLEPIVYLHGMIVCESKKDIILPDHIQSFTKIKDKTYGIKRISIYEKQGA
jgi:16S rRNA (guanine966-N2)-methyltransferase